MFPPCLTMRCLKETMTVLRGCPCPVKKRLGFITGNRCPRAGEPLHRLEPAQARLKIGRYNALVGGGCHALGADGHEERQEEVQRQGGEERSSSVSLSRALQHCRQQRVALFHLSTPGYQPASSHLCYLVPFQTLNALRTCF